MGVVISSSFLRSSTFLPLIVSLLRIHYLEAYSSEGGMSETALKQAVSLNETDFRAALEALKSHDILCEQNNHIYYTVPLMRRWVQMKQPLDHASHLKRGGTAS